MKISSVTNNFFPNTYKKAASKAQSFKAIYIRLCTVKRQTNNKPSLLNPCL